jgi:DNA invertase Pin-like site-specific DNA recombinase
MKTAKSTPAVAYSYIRFSTPSQAEGDSLRRQTEQAAAYCARNNLTLDTSLTLKDLGVSAFRGKNAAVGNFRTFLDAIKSGRVSPGSVLIVEGFDRISRQGIDEGYDLVKSILKAGVIIVTLFPERRFDRDATKSLSKGALEIQLILERAAEESERKSERVGAAWANKRKQAREGGHILTKKLPAWVTHRDGKLVLIPAKVAAVKKVFALAAAGYGYSLIVKKLIEDKVPPLSAKPWSRAYVGKILHDRQAIGELQPRTRNGKADGPVIPDYYPRAVNDTEFNLARAGAAERKKHPGRCGKNVNIFANLLKQAGYGASFYYFAANRPLAGGKSHRVALLTTSETNPGNGVSVRYEPFERDVLNHLREIDPREVFGGVPEVDEAASLKVELDRVEASIGAILSEMEEHGESPALFKRLREKESAQRELINKMAKAQQKKARPIDQAFGEMQTLAGAIAKAKDKSEVRLKLRSVLRRAVAEMHLLVVVRGKARRCVLQINFRDSNIRRYFLLVYDRLQQEPIFSEAWKPDADDLDLKKPADVKLIEKMLNDDAMMAAVFAEAEKKEKVKEAEPKGEKKPKRG